MEAHFRLMNRMHFHEERAKRLVDAIEGECNGLSIDAATAARILEYVETGQLWTSEDDEITGSPS